MGCCAPKEEKDKLQRKGDKEDSYTLQHYGSTAITIPYSYSAPPSEPEHPKQDSTSRSIVHSSSLPTASAKPFGQFTFLEKSYSIDTPSCLVPRINELFKSICDRYDMAVVNREKVDEALELFKQVIGVDKMTSMEESFAAWWDCLANPRFIVGFNKKTGDATDIKVRADIIPKEKRKAQKHMRDLLDACQLFLQQKEFLQREVIADFVQLESLSDQLQTLGKDTGLTSLERKQLPKTYDMALRLFSEFSHILDMFFAHVYSLTRDINGSVHILQSQSREKSLDPV